MQTYLLVDTAILTKLIIIILNSFYSRLFPKLFWYNRRSPKWILVNHYHNFSQFCWQHPKQQLCSLGVSDSYCIYVHNFSPDHPTCLLTKAGGLLPLWQFNCHPLLSISGLTLFDMNSYCSDATYVLSFKSGKL